MATSATSTALGSEGAPVVVPGPGRHRLAFAEMLVCSLLGLVASFVLSIDAITLAADPGAALSCNISAKISCSTVALSWQAQLLGFPNAYLGIFFEAVVTTFAVASLLGTRFPRAFMLGVQALYTIAVAFAYWLFTQAYFVIGALCPWCLLVTATTLLVFMSMTRVNVLEGNLRFGRATRHAQFAVRVGADWWLSGVVLATVAAMVIVRYV